jgi:hypothetical protein
MIAIPQMLMPTADAIRYLTIIAQETLHAVI